MTRRLPALLLVLLPCLAGACASFSGGRHYVSGNEALDAGDPERAIAHLERAAELVPHASEVHNHLGIAYQAVGRRDEAMVSYQRAVDLDCDNGAAQHNLSALRRHLGLTVSGPPTAVSDDR